ncbi:hypothetical protein ACIO5Z_14835 [Streptomyces rochei]|uniref:hypothetical protein n=1 Tax=Streptomyces rochei TaxID=1928 RepID=UPI00380DEA67
MISPQAEAQHQADEFNHRYPVGTLVFAYPGCRPEDGTGTRLVTRTRTKAQLSSSGDPVVWVEGEGAYICLTHVDPVAEDVWKAARAAEKPVEPETARESAARLSPEREAETRKHIAELIYPTYGQRDTERTLAIADAVMPAVRAALLAELAAVRAERDAWRDQRNAVFATNERLLIQVDELGQARLHAENEARAAKREARDELTALRALELGDPDDRVSATCADPGHPTWLRAQDDTRGCPWCRVAELEAERHTTNEALSDAAEQLRRDRDRIAELEHHSTGPDTLAAWLFQRFYLGSEPWERLDEDNRSYWEHEARAVRRAVARGGYKTGEPVR